MRKLLLSGAVLALLITAALWPVGGGPAASLKSASHKPYVPPDLSAYSDAAPSIPLDLVFLHRSIGGHLLSDQGPDDGKWHVHPNGGGLRTLLTQNNYRVHDATYGSKLGEPTDMFDWLPKFRDHMSEVLRIDTQDTLLPEGTQNRIVMFKSCFPNNYFVEEGSPPGNPNGPELTVENAKATFRALLPIFAKHPDTLFVYLTIPPNVGIAQPERGYKALAKALLGKPSAREKLETHGMLARTFNDWAASRDGWLAEYEGTNVVVFHLYDVLTDRGASNFLQYATGGGLDDHPSSEGLSKVAREFVPFLNRAVRRAGLITETAAVAPAEGNDAAATP